MRKPQSLNNNDSNNENQVYKKCAGMNCDSIGSNRLKIILINKIGYFCNKCSKDLLQLKLVEMP
jgi:hypothetical protein